METGSWAKSARPARGRTGTRMQSLGPELEKQAAQSTKVHPAQRPADPLLTLHGSLTSLLGEARGALCWQGDLVIPSESLKCGKRKHTVVYSGLI